MPLFKLNLYFSTSDRKYGFLAPITTFTLLLLLLVSLASAAELSRESKNAIQAQIQYQPTSYRVGPGDILSVEVLNEPEYSQEQILVRPDGRATFLGVGELQVGNTTIEDISDILRQRLSRILINPKLMVSIKTMKPSTVYLSGAVMQPGMFQFSTNANQNNLMIQAAETKVRTDMRLSNILANAGGVTMDADLSNIAVTDAITGEITHVNFWKVLRDGDISQDIWVNSGDHIHIPHTMHLALSDEDFNLLLGASIGPKSFPVRVMGEVNQPGVYTLDAASPFLNSALAKAGGTASQAGTRKVAIRRLTSNHDFSTIFVNENRYDLTLRPNDVVYVFESALSKTSRRGNEFAKALAPIQSIGILGASASQIFGFGGWANIRGLNNH